MSASLVGSEMCIRDRHTSCADSGLFGSRCPVGAPDTSPMPVLHQWEAVSYTHLTLPTICSV
eukprot:7514241-Alexandrium_andersonii.AAC.1